MPKVYVTRHDPDAMPDVGPARRYGELVFLPNNVNFTALENGDPAPLTMLMREFLKDMEPGDYLLPLGHQAVMIIAGIIAAEFLDGAFRILVWERRPGRYDVVPINDNFYARLTT